jgi:hypothetical protein
MIMRTFVHKMIYSVIMVIVIVATIVFYNTRKNVSRLYVASIMDSVAMIRIILQMISLIFFSYIFVRVQKKP